MLKRYMPLSLFAVAPVMAFAGQASAQNITAGAPAHATATVATPVAAPAATAPAFDRAANHCGATESNCDCAIRVQTGGSCSASNVPQVCTAQTAAQQRALAAAEARCPGITAQINRANTGTTRPPAPVRPPPPVRYTCVPGFGGTQVGNDCHCDPYTIQNPRGTLCPEQGNGATCVVQRRALVVHGHALSVVCISDQTPDRALAEQVATTQVLRHDLDSVTDALNAFTRLEPGRTDAQLIAEIRVLRQWIEDDHNAITRGAMNGAAPVIDFTRYDVAIANLGAVTDTYCPPLPNEPDATMARRCQVEHDRLGHGLQGPQGIPGPVGPAGRDGTNGTNGRDGRDGAATSVRRDWWSVGGELRFVLRQPGSPTTVGGALTVEFQHQVSERVRVYALGNFGGADFGNMVGATMYGGAALGIIGSLDASNRFQLGAGIFGLGYFRPWYHPRNEQQGALAGWDLGLEARIRVNITDHFALGLTAGIALDNANWLVGGNGQPVATNGTLRVPFSIAGVVTPSLIFSF